MSATSSEKPTEARRGLRMLSRRRLLQVGAVSGALVLLGSTLAVVRTRGYDVDPARARALKALAPWQFVVVEHVARRMVAPDRPGDPTIPTSDEVDVAGFVDRFCANMPPRMRRDLLRFLTLVEHVAPLTQGRSSRFSRLAPAEQDAVLAYLESHSNPLFRTGFEGLKTLVMMGYYRDARTWRIVGYDGPLVGRPPYGWTR